MGAEAIALTHLFIAWKYSSDCLTLSRSEMFIKVFTDCAMLPWNHPSVPRIIPITRYSYASHRSFYRGMSLMRCFVSVRLPSTFTEPTRSQIIAAVIQGKWKSGRRMHLPSEDQHKLPLLLCCLSPQGWKWPLLGGIWYISYEGVISELGFLWWCIFLNSISSRLKIYYLSFAILWIWKNIQRSETSFISTPTSIYQPTIPP